MSQIQGRLETRTDRQRLFLKVSAVAVGSLALRCYDGLVATALEPKNTRIPTLIVWRRDRKEIQYLTSYMMSKRSDPCRYSLIKD